jgi:hypothetical protein
MKNLHGKELDLWNALVNDYKHRGDLSFLNIMFVSGTKSEEELKTEFREGSEGLYEPLLAESDMLLFSMESSMIGKYKDTFWIKSSEGELNSIGKKLYNLPYVLLESVGDLNNEKNIAKYFKEVFNTDYFEYKKQYIKLCLSFGFKYEENINFVYEGRVEFEKQLEVLK